MKNNYKISIFTSTYDRAYILENLYDSLKQQTNPKFDWIIVDDGSTDNTCKIVKKWIREKFITIHYLYQKNSGKMSAINKGVKLSNSELFFIVDSDDQLMPDSIESVISIWNNKNDKISGIAALCGKINNPSEPIGNSFLPNKKTETLYNLYNLYKFKGDAALVYRTDILRRYPYPIIKGEKFIPDGYIYNQIDQKYKLILLNKIIYLCEYLPDGYTKNLKKNIRENPQSFLLSYKQRYFLASSLPLMLKIKNKIKCLIAILAIGRYINGHFNIHDINNRFLAIILLPISYFFYRLRFK